MIFFVAHSCLEMSQAFFSIFSKTYQEPVWRIIKKQRVVDGSLTFQHFFFYLDELPARPTYVTLCSGSKVERKDQLLYYESFSDILKYLVIIVDILQDWHSPSSAQTKRK